VSTAVHVPTQAAMRRLAVAGDFGEVYAFYMHAQVVPLLGVDPMLPEDFRAVFDGLLASGGFYVVEREGRVRGFYKAQRQQGRSAHAASLGTIAIDPAEQGSGLARAMLDEAIAALRQEGVRRIALTVEADNPRALRFYQKLGFEVEGRLRAAYRRAGAAADVDQLLMALLLAP
jgi:ribosomal protein S18 acetylase RimI-like enzyme